MNTVCHSCCHHREFMSWRIHEQRCCDRGFEMTSQLLPLTLEWKNVTQTKRRRDMRLTSWLRSQLRRVSSETWSGSKPSLKSSLESRLLVNMAPDANGHSNRSSNSNLMGSRRYQPSFCYAWSDICVIVHCSSLIIRRHDICAVDGFVFICQVWSEREIR